MSSALDDKRHVRYQTVTSAAAMDLTSSGCDESVTFRRRDN